MPLVLTLKAVPLPDLPPKAAVPYRVLPEKINPPSGAIPSLPPVKLYKLVRPVPSAWRANTVPLPELPPDRAVPYRVLPDKSVTNPPAGLAPSLLARVLGSVAVKLCRTVKVCAVTGTTDMQPRAAIRAGRNMSLMRVFMG